MLQEPLEWFCAAAASLFPGPSANRTSFNFYTSGNLPHVECVQLHQSVNDFRLHLTCFDTGGITDTHLDADCSVTPVNI